MRPLAGALVAVWALLTTGAVQAQQPATLVHLLDYIAVDYGEAVAEGKVRNADEYREMAEFASNVREGIARLPQHPEKGALQDQAGALEKRIAAKASAEDVASAASRLRQSIVAVYQVAVGPRRAPDAARGASLFQAHCGGCHGADGRGNGPLANGMEPRPTDFHDAERPALRSVHSLYNTISLGVAGTPMRAFSELTEDDRWALAFRVAAWGVDPAKASEGRAAWDAHRWRGELGSVAAIAGQSRREIESRWAAEAAAVAAYLITSPQALEQGKPAPLEIARTRLDASEALFREGKRAEAHEAALSAYLDGFELAEAGIATVDADLVRRLEAAMIDYRGAIKEGDAPRVAELAARIRSGLDEAAHALSQGGLSPTAAATASFIVLFREGLEAVLVVAALAAFLRRSGQAHAMPYLHAGWVGALALGLVTWIVGTWVMDLSGAGRETTEGVTALIASAMLIYVGFWLHDKSHASAWQRFLMQGAAAVKPGAAWGLAGMAFLAVYREVFETVLFYQALWAQAPEALWPIAGGFVAAAASLAAVAWGMLRYSLRLPLGLFFGASGLLLAVLGIVLAGNGIAALQEAGALPITPAPIFELRWLGVHANWQSLAAQLVATSLVVVLLWRSRARAAQAEAAT